LRAGLLDTGAQHLVRINHDIADEVDALGRHALGQQIPVGIR